MVKQLLTSACLLIGLSTGLSQNGKGAYAGLTVFKEQDIFSPNSPVGLAGTAKIGKLFVQGDYRRSFSKVKEFQTIAPTESYGFKIGICGASPAKGVSAYGLAFGVQLKNQFYKKIVIDEADYPVDVNNQVVEMDKANILVDGTQFSLGLVVLQAVINESGSMEGLIDDFDIKMNKNKKRYSTVIFGLEMLYMPKLNYSRQFDYSPYGFFIPRQLTMNASLKERHFGVKMRVEYAAYTRVGVLFEMGLLPGIMHKADNYNDFNLGFRVGVIANFSAFTKSE